MEVVHLATFPADLHLSGRGKREFDDLRIDHGEFSNPGNVLPLQSPLICKHCFNTFDYLLRLFRGLCSQRFLRPANK